MKKVFLTAISAVALLAASFSATAQTNLQTFYDFGRDRGHFTTTLEGFHADKWGNTFFFVDYDYNAKDSDDKFVGVSGSYFEISRALCFWGDTKLKDLSAHVEYNGGVGFGSQNFLFGANYFLHSKDFANTLTLSLMYKTFNGSASSDCPVQFTVVWGMNNLCGVKGLNFSGFADIWGENTNFWYGDLAAGRVNALEATENPGKFVFISEPQIWYNVGQHFGVDNLNIGGELELSYNFAGSKGFFARPCIGTKWVF